MNNQNIVLFENRQVRRYYDTENEIWYFSIVDIVEALTESVNPTDYLKKLRKRDAELGSYLGTNCPQVEMLSNGKKRKTLAGTAEDIFRLIQSIPFAQRIRIEIGKFRALLPTPKSKQRNRKHIPLT